MVKTKNQACDEEKVRKRMQSDYATLLYKIDLLQTEADRIKKALGLR